METNTRLDKALKQAVQRAKERTVCPDCHETIRLPHSLGVHLRFGRCRPRARQVFMQKHNPTMEFCGFDHEQGLADFSVNLGNLDLRDGMTKQQLIDKLQTALDRLRTFEGDVFVVQ